jgi:hypothetical protein
MSDPMRVGLAVVLVAAGMAGLGWAGYLQYAALPEEHTFAQGGKRVALALAGTALILVGSRLLA